MCGEYAVLDGAAAICAAVDRRALVTVTEAEGDHHVVRAPGYSQLEAAFLADSGELSWQQGGKSFDLFEQVWQKSSPRPERPLQFSLDTTAFHDPGSGMKIGVGSSAALAVALATAFEAIGGDDAIHAARNAHSGFQGGLGSGIDVACSQSGGVIEFRRDGPEVNPVDWPDGLHCAVLWSGVAADTRARIKRLDSGVDREFVEFANQCADKIGTGSADDVLDALREYTRALREFDEASGLEIFSAGHGALADSAPRYDVVYKPCGAGGGDIGLAVASSAESLASFCEAASGFERLDVRIDFAGACLDKAP